jgi:YkoY family integral membrane protein
MAPLLPFSSTEAALLPELLVLETVLSADNALALASLVQPLEPEAERERLLNWGVITAMLLRLLTVAAAGSLLHHPAVRVLGGAYLVWLALRHFRAELGLEATEVARTDGPDRTAASHRPPGGMRMVLMLAVTNLAFSIDSICAAFALTDNLALVMVAGAVGLLALRGVTGLVLRWMRRFPNLANAGHLTVLAVGLRLISEQVTPFLTPSEPVMAGAMTVLLGWGLIRPQAARS